MGALAESTPTTGANRARRTHQAISSSSSPTKGGTPAAAEGLHEPRVRDCAVGEERPVGVNRRTPGSCCQPAATVAGARRPCRVVLPKGRSRVYDEASASQHSRDLRLSLHCRFERERSRHGAVAKAPPRVRRSALTKAGKCLSRPSSATGHAWVAALTLRVARPRLICTPLVEAEPGETDPRRGLSASVFRSVGGSSM